MLVYQVSPTLLPLTADLVASFYETGEYLVTSIAPCTSDRVVVFGDVQVEEVCSWKVVLAVDAAVGMGLLIMRVVLDVRFEAYGLVRWEKAAHG